MGMYDNLKINTNLLPITDEEKSKIGKIIGWQTKDLECTLSTAEITDDGKLIFFDFDDNEKWIDINNINVINFYSDTNIGWLEFNAIFENGVLIKIIRDNGN